MYRSFSLQNLVARWKGTHELHRVVLKRTGISPAGALRFAVEKCESGYSIPVDALPSVRLTPGSTLECSANSVPIILKLPLAFFDSKPQCPSRANRCLFNTTRCNSCVPFHLATKFWRLNDLYIINNCSYLQREHFWKTLHSTDVLTATTVCARPFWWTFTRGDVKIKLKFPTNINFKTEPWSLMRRQDVVRRRDLNSKVKMIFEEKSDAIKIDVSRIRDEE